MTAEELMTQPMPDFAAARRAMIDSQLRPQGVTNTAVLAAMALIPREEFLPEGLRALAYTDRPLDLGGGKAMMPPAALAKLLTELDPQAGERALVVGSGNSYAPALLRELGLEVEVGHGTGQFDIVLIDGAVESVPDELADRLKPDGRLGTAIADNGVTRLAIGQKGGTSLGLRRFADVQMPVLSGFTKPRAFTF